jgi:hypothetical protein
MTPPAPAVGRPARREESMKAMKKRPKVGDLCWEVEWREDRPDDEEPRYVHRNFPTREAAFDFAQKSFARAVAGGVPLMLVTPYEWVEDGDGVCFWEAQTEGECYEGE